MEDYKEKYEQAMLRMNKWVEGSEITEPKEVAEFVFPELKESNDEKIRKGLIQHLKELSKVKDLSHTPIKFKQYYDVWISWLEKPKYTEEDLDKAYKCADEVQYRHGYEDAKKEIEKQGEQKQNIIDIISDLENYFATTTKEQQEKDWDEIKNWEEKHFNHDRHIGIKPTDKVEPIKIEKDKWYICIRDLYDNYYTRAFCKGRTYHAIKDETLMPDNSNIPCEIKYFVNDYFRLWTIQDAKDGDVLTTHLSPEGDWIGIYKQSTDNMFETYCFLNAVGEFVINPNRCKNHGTHGLHPATKEQCDLLFQKMKEAGYKWDADKKELEKIEQKTAWSEEDEDMIDLLVDILKINHPNDYFKVNQKDEVGIIAVPTKKIISWLKSIKERMKGE